MMVPFSGVYFMAIFTLAEIETEIATYKAALSALAAARTTKIGEKEVTRHDIPSLREHLEWLDNQRNTLIATGGTVPTAAGRTYAKNGRRY